MQISILYNTIRPGGIDLLRQSLNKQTHRDFDVVIVDGYRDRERVVCKYLSDYQVTYLKGLPKKENDVWTLNKDYNFGLKHCNGDIIVFMQDYLWIPHDALERIKNAHEVLGDVFVTSHGSKAQYPDKKEVEGDITIWHTPYLTKPTGISEHEGRTVQGSGYEEISYDAWEMNFASAPLRVLNEVGGFDEDMDEYYGGDNVVVACKAYSKGVRFYMDKGLEIIGFNQGALFPRQADWEDKHSNKGYLQEKTWKILHQE